jgi:FlaA1/EpsC-like NDP-sugar epimerase
VALPVSSLQLQPPGDPVPVVPHERPSPLARAFAWVRLNGVIFVGEVLIIWVLLESFQYLGYGGQVGQAQGGPPFPVTMLMCALAMGAGEARFRLYRRVWSVAGLSDAMAIGLAVTEAAFLITVANWLMGLYNPTGDLHLRPWRLAVPPLATPAIVIGIGLFRLLPRLLSRVPASGNRLLVVVQDSNGYATVKALAQHPNPDWKPIGIVTREANEEHKTVMGIPILGTVTSLGDFLKSSQADGVAFVLEDTPVSEQSDLISICLAAQKPIFILSVADQMFPRQRAAPMRQLSADDLVGRAQRTLQLEEAGELIKGRTVLVTGAAGSIGSELCRLLAKAGPRRLVLLDDNESGLFDINEELLVDAKVDLRTALISITERESLLGVFADERPEIVFHTAAYKHVPLLENHPIQAFNTNVIGTQNVIRCAEASGVKNLILISTDKAVARHSVMGCTKRICEQMILAYQGEMTCWAVRFGNVVGSRGSVVPLFEKQILQGGPVTITHPEMTRYMMTIREAVSLVISTLMIARPGHVYMLDMGKPIKIASLAQDLIRSRGLRPGEDIKLVYTGLRPGERLTEELLAPDEGVRPTVNPAIMEVVSPASISQQDLDWTIERLNQLARDGQPDRLEKALKNAVRDTGLRRRAEEPSPKRTKQSEVSTSEGS